MTKLKEEELLEELKQMEVDEKETHKGSLKVPGVNTKLMNQVHQKRKQAHEQIRELIQKKPVTDAWYEEKAIELYNLLYYKTFNMQQVKDSIHSLVESVPAKKPTVDEEFMGKWADKFDGFIYENPSLIIDIDLLKQMLIEAGVEVVEKR